MKSSENIENILERLGSEWPEDGSIVEGVMQTIESPPPHIAAPKRRRMVMKSLFAIGASLVACVVLWWTVEGSHNTLYAQVIDAVHKARTIHIIHYGQREEKAEPTKIWESWYEKGVGFRRDGYNQTRKGSQSTVCLGNEDDIWTLLHGQKNTVIHSRSKGITKETEQIFADIDRHASHLQKDGQRYPEGDQTFDGQRCKAFLLTKSDRSQPSLETGKLRQLFYLDQQSRLVRVESQAKDGDRWKTKQFNTIRYDEPFDSALFQPNFGKDFKIVDAGVKSTRPEATKPEGPVLIYQFDPNYKTADTTMVDMDKLLRAVDIRLNGGAEKLAAVRKLNDRQIEVALMRRDEEDRPRIERQLTRPGTLEFRILANYQNDKTLIERAKKEQATTEILDSSGKRVAWWVPVRAGSNRDFSHAGIAMRTKNAGNRKVKEILVVTDTCNVTGAYLTGAKIQFNSSGDPTVSFTFNDAGGKLFGKLTGDHLPDPSNDSHSRLGIIIDGELFSAPIIQTRIGNEGQICGSFNEIEASDLAAVLNAGSLPVRLRRVENPTRP